MKEKNENQKKEILKERQEVGEKIDCKKQPEAQNQEGPLQGCLDLF